MVPVIYEQQTAPLPLHPWVVAIWQIRGATAASARGDLHRVLPDGCVDILFEGDAARLVGPMTRALIAPILRYTDILGVRFRSGVVSALAAINACEIQDAVVPLEKTAIRLAVNHEQLFKRTSLAERASFLMPALASYLAARPARDLAVGAAIEAWIGAKDGQPLASVAAVARHVGLSERSLERRFAACVGHAPAQFRRLARFRAALRLFESGHCWVDIATECGYSDQAHLSRDFREFASTTPTAWAAEQKRVGFFQDTRV